ncbi:hypothetical protein [Aquibium oceanicum]|uniref:hypothetical protein n=1 Tax=Aquibium oceanicum TaxID=1670800 RepID=UPI0012FF94D9|nr:hypothetical protein [Aquibium oceanicum]
MLLGADCERTARAQYPCQPMQASISLSSGAEGNWSGMLNRKQLGRLAPSRLNLMMILAGGLYLGPLLAGLSQQPRWTVAVCAGVLVLWSVLYRSASWPRRLADLGRPEVVLATMLLVCVMLALSGLSFLAGLGLAQIAGGVSLPLWVPLGIPLLSLTIALFIQSPREATEMDAFLDDALRQLEGFPPLPPTPNISRAVAAKLEELREGATVDEVRTAIGEATVHDAALLAAIDKMGVPPPRPALVAAILIVTDPTGAPGLEARGEAAWVFDAIGGDPELEMLFARRALELLAEAPFLFRDMPYSYDVDQSAARSPEPEAAQALKNLRDRLNELSKEEDDLDESGAAE